MNLSCKCGNNELDKMNFTVEANSYSGNEFHGIEIKCSNCGNCIRIKKDKIQYLESNSNIENEKYFSRSGIVARIL